jgi:hypothetical protein
LKLRRCNALVEKMEDSGHKMQDARCKMQDFSGKYIGLTSAVSSLLSPAYSTTSYQIFNPAISRVLAMLLA